MRKRATRAPGLLRRPAPSMRTAVVNTRRSNPKRLDYIILYYTRLDYIILD